MSQLSFPLHCLTGFTPVGCVALSLYRFKSLYHLLKDMKSEIEHRQHLLEKAKVQLQKDFETWWEDEASRMRVRVGGCAVGKMRVGM